MRIYFKDPNIRVNPFSAPGLIMRTSFKIGWEISVSLTPCRHKTQCTSRTLHHDLLMSYFCSVSCQFYICTGAFLSFIVRVCRTESSHLFTQWHQKISIKKYFKYFPTVEKARNPMKLKNKTNSFTSFLNSSIKEIIYKQMRIYREILGGIIVNLLEFRETEVNVQLMHSCVHEVSFHFWDGSGWSLPWLVATVPRHLCHPVDTELWCPK